MKNRHLKTVVILVAVSVFWLSTNTFGAADTIVIGHQVCLSGKYAKAGEQAIGGKKYVLIG